MVMMPLLALLGPFGAVVLSFLLALAVCYAAVYARLYHCLASQSSVSGPEEEALQLQGKVVKAVSMLGMHIEDLPGGDIITIQDQQNAHQQAVMKLFNVYGHRNTNTYTTYSNPEMQVLLLPGVGCMVYTTCQHWGLQVIVAAGDPVCDPQHDLLMLQIFRVVFPGGALIDVSKDVARLWVQQEGKQPGPSMTVTDMGTETIVDVQKYNFEFNKRTKEIRRNADAAARAGLIIEEVTAHSSAAVKEQVQQLAAVWQQGKEVTDDLKVFSRIIPFQHLGREKDARVFIARTLGAGEASAPFTVAMATEKLEQQKAAAAAAKMTATVLARAEDDDTTSSAACRSSEQQRKKRARRALARQQKQQQQQQQCNTGSDAGSAAPSSTASDTDFSDLIIVTCNTKELPDHQQQQQKQQKQQQQKQQKQQQQKQQQETASITAAAGGGNSGSSIHACVMLDPIYRHGEVVGYFVQRTFLSPEGPKGAPKLVLKEVMGLLKAEGRCFLNHGPAPAYNTKSGADHGFTDCAWLRRSLQLCWQYGNSFYAFQNLGMAKSSWGGGYDPDDDSLKFKEAVTLNRRFVLLPPSWRFQLSHGPLMLLVVFRHVGLFGDPWELFAFWRFW